MAVQHFVSKCCSGFVLLMGHCLLLLLCLSSLKGVPSQAMPPLIAKNDSNSATLEDITFNTDLLVMMCTSTCAIVIAFTVQKCLRTPNSDSSGACQDIGEQSLQLEVAKKKVEISEMQVKILQLERRNNTLASQLELQLQRSNLYCCPKGRVFHANQFCQGAAKASDMKAYRLCKTCGQQLFQLSVAE